MVQDKKKKTKLAILKFLYCREFVKDPINRKFVGPVTYMGPFKLRSH